MIIRLIFISILMNLSFSQAGNHKGDNHGHGKGSHLNQGVVFGKILNNETKSPVEYSSVSIYSANDEKLVSGGISDENGYFIIDNIPDGNYKVVIEFIGYEQHIVNVVINKETGLKIDLGIVDIIPKSIDTEEVNITGEMPTVEFETDKLVYTPSKDILSTSGSAEDVLNNVPMVLVDQDGSVSLRGNSNVKILVNGRQNRTGEGGNDVDNIPAALIERVEVITSPSAKYDPEGMAGIINIILKKGDDDGFNGSIKTFGKHNAHHSLDEMNGISLSGNYKMKKINLYSSISLNNRYRNSIGFRKVETTYHAFEDTTGVLWPEFIDLIDFSNDNENHKRNQKLRVGFDYYITKQLVLNTEINYATHQSNSNNLQTIREPVDDAGEISTEEHDIAGNYDIEGVIGLTKSYDNPDREFSIFISKDFEKDNEIEQLNESAWVDQTEFFEHINMTEIDVSYMHPINELSKIEVGYDGLLNDNSESSDYMMRYYGDENEINIDNFSGLNEFLYKRYIHGVFFEYSRKMSDRWSMKPGIRVEYVDKDISFLKDPDVWFECPDDAVGVDYLSLEDCGNECSVDCLEISSTGNIYSQLLDDTPSSTYTSDYTSVYPSFHLTYNITNKKSLQFAMSKRVDRPGDGGHGGGSRQIRPFPRDIYTDEFIFIGNPFLEPEYSTQYEVSYKSPIPMGFFYTNLYYHAVKNVIEWYDDDSYDDVDILTFRNADDGTSYGVELFTMIMGQTLGGGYWYNTISDGSDDVELNGFDEGMNAYMKINLPEKYIKFFGYEFGFYYMKMKNKYGSLFGDKGTLWANMGFSKSLFSDRARISFNVNNIFDSGGFQMKITKPLDPGDSGYFDNGYTSASEFSDVNYSRNGRTYSLTLKVNFGKMQEDKMNFRRHDDHDGGGGTDMGY